VRDEGEPGYLTLSFRRSLLGLNIERETFELLLHRFLVVSIESATTWSSGGGSNSYLNSEV
jgi:hypothetical protein